MPAAATASPARSAALDQLVADPENLVAQLGDVGTDPRADLDDRLVHLPLDLIAEGRGRGGEQCDDVRPELPRLRVDDLELLFDAQREAVHEGDVTSG